MLYFRYNEFHDMIEPNNEDYANILNKRTPTYVDNDELDLVLILFKISFHFIINRFLAMILEKQSPNYFLYLLKMK